MHLQVFRRNKVGVANHRCLIRAHRNLAVVGPALPRNLRRRQRLKLPQHLCLCRLRQRCIRRNQPNAGAHIVLGLRQQIGRDQFRVAGVVSNNKDFRRPGKLVDADRPKDLPLRLVHKRIARANDLVHLRHTLCAEGHGGDGLGPANAEDAVCTGQMAARDHGRMRIRWQAGNHLVATRNLSRNDGHDGCGQQRKAATRNVRAHTLNRNDTVSQVQPWQRLHLKRLDGGKLRLREPSHIANGELCIFAGLLFHAVYGSLAVGGAYLKGIELRLVEPLRVLTHCRIATRLHSF